MRSNGTNNKSNRSAQASLYGWLEEGPFTLALSAGFFGFYAHAGIVSVFSELGLKPKRILGCSAGALVGGLWSAGMSPDAMKAALFNLTRSDFWDPGIGFGLLRGQKFAHVLQRLIGEPKIESLPTQFASCVFNVRHRRTEFINSGSLEKAIRASCALPGLFQPVKIDNHWFLDGGILDRLAMSNCSPDERVLAIALPSQSRPRQQLNEFASEAHRVLKAPKFTRVNPFKLDMGAVAYHEGREWALSLIS